MLKKCLIGSIVIESYPISIGLPLEFKPKWFMRPSVFFLMVLFYNLKFEEASLKGYKCSWQNLIWRIRMEGLTLHCKNQGRLDLPDLVSNLIQKQGASNGLLFLSSFHFIYLKCFKILFRSSRSLSPLK